MPESPNESQSSLGAAQEEPDDQIRARCDFIIALQQHIQQCEAELNYPEAQKCKTRLDELYEEDRRARVIRLRARHQFETHELESVAAQEAQQLDEIWTDKIQQFEFKAQEQLQKAREKHEEQRIDEEASQLEKIERQIPKASKTLLELRRTQEELVKTGRYEEAEQYKVKGDALERLEQQKRDEDAAAKVEKCLEEFDKRIEVEYSNLTSRIREGRKQLKEAKDAEFDRLKKKQENLRRDLQNEQVAEMNRLKRAPFGLPFVLDQSGNDVLSMPNGVSELNKMAGQKRVVEPAQSFVRAYIDGDLRVKAGDVYFSVAQTHENDQQQEGQNANNDDPDIDVKNDAENADISSHEDAPKDPSSEQQPGDSENIKEEEFDSVNEQIQQHDEQPQEDAVENEPNLKEEITEKLFED